MFKIRLTYLLICFITIIAGLLCRHFAGIPLFIGDILWATLVYLLVRLLFIKHTVNWVVLFSLLFCYSIEFSQLYKAPWINRLRHTLFGRLVLGETFLWGDLLCYTIGIAIAVVIDKILRKQLRFQ